MTSRARVLRPVHRSRRGAVLQVVSAVVAAGVVAWAGIAVTVPTSKRPVAQPSVTPPPNRLEVLGTLGTLGLEPKSLAAAGFTPSQAASAVTAGLASIRGDIASLRQALSVLGTANGEYHRLRSLVQSGRATPEDRVAYAAAGSLLAQARSAHRAALDRVYSNAMDGIPGPVRARHETIRSNGSWSMATPFLSVARTEAEWVALREAFANDRISDRLGLEPDPRGHQLLLAAGSDPVVSAATTATQANLEAITVAWNQLVGE